MAADAVGGILLAAVTLYAVLGGADFGAGLWDLLAGGDRRGRAPRRLIDYAITPVWEANHVWLVFILVIFWTAFPHAFAAVMNAAALPLWLALAGIVLRGSGFAFRKEVHRLDAQRILGATFAFSSLVTPFFMGTVIGAIATGSVPADASRAILSAWTSPTALLAGFLFVAACGYLAAVYLVGEAARGGDRGLATYFARRAQVAGVVAGALSLGALAELHTSDRFLYDRLTGRALPLVVVAGVCGLAVVVLLATRLTADRRWESAIRAIAALGVAAVVWGWGVAQYPVLLPGTPVTLNNGGAPHATLVALVVLFVVVVVLIGPSFGLLFVLQGRRLLHADEGAVLAGPVTADRADPSRGSPGQQPTALRAAAFALAIGTAIIRRRNRRLGHTRRMEDHFDFQALRVQQPRKLLPSRANYEIFGDGRKLVALVNEADTHTRLALLRQTMPDTRVLTVATPAGAPILTLIKQTSEWITELLGPDEERIGLIRTEGSRRHYTLIDEQDKTVGKVEGDLGLKHFAAKSPKGEKFALVRKTFAGFAKEMLTPSDHYKVEFIAPAAQPARTLIVMLPIVLDLTLYGPV